MNRASYYLAIARSESLIRRYFSRRSSDADEISDLTQETIAALLDAHNRFRGACAINTWVYSVCSNTYRKHVYYAVKRRKMDETLQEKHAAAMSAAEAVEINCPNRAGVSLILGLLNPSDKRLFHLYYTEKRSVSEVASLLSRTEGTTKWLLYRLRGRIREAVL